MLKLIAPTIEPNWIHPSKLKDGEIAVIRSWGTSICYIGTIVIRCSDRLVIIGGYSRTDYWRMDSVTGLTKVHVEILPKGTQFQID